jgi:hypothetical protein
LQFYPYYSSASTKLHLHIPNSKSSQVTGKTQTLSIKLKPAMQPNKPHIPKHCPHTAAPMLTTLAVKNGQEYWIGNIGSLCLFFIL